MSDKKVVLVKGGMSVERDISLRTGDAFEDALKSLPYEYSVIDAKEDLPQKLIDANADVALLALHGKFAEDGVVQGLCEYMRLPYSGSGVLSSALCMDKIYSKKIYIQNDIPTAEFEYYELKDDTLASIERILELPVVVKPSREGSSVGVSIVSKEEDFVPALQEAAKHDNFILVEKFIDGHELTVPVLNGKALAPIEIVPKQDFYDYTNKYTSGQTDYYLPARVSDEVVHKLKKIAEDVYRACRVETYCRVDFRMDEENRVYVIETNTLPGFTATSLFPMSAKYEGIEFKELIQALIEGASLDYEGVR